MEITNWVKVILHSLHEGVLIADSNGIVKYINPAYTRITMVSNDEILGESLSEKRPGSRLTHVIQSGKELLRIPRKVGDIEYIVNMVPIIENAQTIGGISILTEITEIHKITEQLNKSNIMIKHLQKHLKGFGKAKYCFNDIISVDSSSFETKKLAKRISKNESNVLITGESGTGKEL